MAEEISGCLEKACKDCEWHIIKAMKLDCNKGNRLGLAEPVLGSFGTRETDKDKLKAKLESKKKEMVEIEKALQESGEEVS